MPIRELHAFSRQTINVWRWDLAPFRVVALHIAVTKIVRIEDYDVGFGGSGGTESTSEKQDGEEESRFHDRSNRSYTTDRTNL